MWPGKDTPDACKLTANGPASDDLNKCNISIFYDPNNAAAAEVYRKAHGVKSTIALVGEFVSATHETG